jgi:hypothetical protein
MSSIFEGFLSISEMLETFGERNFIQTMLRFEASLARAGEAGPDPAGGGAVHHWYLQGGSF